MIMKINNAKNNKHKIITKKKLHLKIKLLKKQEKFSLTKNVALMSQRRSSSSRMNSTNFTLIR